MQSYVGGASKRKKSFLKRFSYVLGFLSRISQPATKQHLCILRFSKATPAPNRRIELIRQPLYYPTRWIDAGWYTLLFSFLLSPFPPPLRGIQLQLGIVARAGKQEECDLQSYPFQMTFPSFFLSASYIAVFGAREREGGGVWTSFFLSPVDWSRHGLDIHHHF